MRQQGVVCLANFLSVPRNWAASGLADRSAASLSFGAADGVEGFEGRSCIVEGTAELAVLENPAGLRQQLQMRLGVAGRGKKHEDGFYGPFSGGIKDAGLGQPQGNLGA